MRPRILRVQPEFLFCAIFYAFQTRQSTIHICVCVHFVTYQFLRNLIFKISFTKTERVSIIWNTNSKTMLWLKLLRAFRNHKRVWEYMTPSEKWCLFYSIVNACAQYSVIRRQLNIELILIFCIGIYMTSNDKECCFEISWPLSTLPTKIFVVNNNCRLSWENHSIKVSIEYDDCDILVRNKFECFTWKICPV